MRSARQLIRFAGLDAHEESALATRAHRHVAVDEERETAEHALLGQPTLVRKEAPHTVRQVFVERHGQSVGLARARMLRVRWRSPVRQLARHRD
jgi:hypothetical protein